MVPSLVRITSGEPPLAQALAQSRLMGFSRPLVKAQAESRTYPLTVAGLPSAAKANGMASASNTINALSDCINFLISTDDDSSCPHGSIRPHRQSTNPVSYTHLTLPTSDLV